MDFEGVNSVMSDAEEADWLDVTYAERNYVEPKPKKFSFKIKLNKKLAIIAAASLCVLVFACFVAFNTDFRNGIAQTAKQAFDAVISAFDGKQDNVATKIDIPCNVNLDGVTDGIATFSGGRTALSFTNGKVTQATENSVTVQLDETVSVVYGNLTSVFVKAGDEVSANDLLGKYEQTFTANITKSGEMVKEVSATETQLTWNV